MRVLLTLGLLLHTIATSAANECEVETTFAEYQAAVFAEASTDELKRFFSIQNAAQIEDGRNFVTGDEVESRYRDPAIEAESEYDHDVWLRDETACLAIDGVSRRTGSRVNVIYIYIWELSGWKLADYYLAKPTDDEDWRYTGKADHRRACLRHDWKELSARIVLPRNLSDADRFVPNCIEPSEGA